MSRVTEGRDLNRTEGPHSSVTNKSIRISNCNPTAAIPLQPMAMTILAGHPGPQRSAPKFPDVKDALAKRRWSRTSGLDFDEMEWVLE